LEAENETLKGQLTAKNEENETLARQLEDMHSSYSQTRQKSVNLEEAHDK
jgi:predicted RNase H-like nuclease (RuvC/YqgF family)